MDFVIQTLEALEATTKRLEKEALLANSLQNPLMSRFFEAALNPYKTYGLQNIILPTQSTESCGSADGAHILMLFDLLEELQERSLVGNEARAVVEHFLQNLPKLEQKWFHRCILKNLRCGVEAKTVNKVIPGLIPTFEVMLANEVEAKRGDGTIEIVSSITYPVWCDYKLDGLRTLSDIENNKATLRSRKGHEIDTLPSIAAELSRIGGAVVLDGESMAADWNESQSILASTVNTVDDSKIIYNVFDMVPLDVWKSHGKSLPYKDRRAELEDLVQRLGSPRIQIVPGQLILNSTDLKKFYYSVIAQGYEGIMVKDPRAPYEFKESNAIRKLKPKQSWDGVVVGMNYGDPNGKWGSRFGGFKVQFVKGGPTTDVGGGFTDAQREFFTSDLLANSTIHNGRTMEVEGQEMGKDGKVRFPIFKGFRDAKDK